ncbi:MAG: alpha-L-fucosidase, partial [Chitinophagaceae bacterium]|nr:alpha-L-fucosidase [Chitinophagaceae bacterium]
LLTHYGRIDEVWFDGAKGESVEQEYYFEKWYQLIRKLQPQAVIAIMGPDVRWVGTETGYGRETEWSVVPTDNLSQSTIAANSQKNIAFTPNGDMRGDDLGSLEKIRKAKGLVWYPAEIDVSIRPSWFYHEAEDSKVKSPEKLLDIYFNSVGRNGVLLLNIPPDKRGLIHESDIAALEQWKQLRDDLFKTNFASGSKIKSANGVNTRYILDGKNATHFTTKGNATTTVIELQLKSPASFNVVQLQENIRMGQRVEAFELDYWDGTAWKITTKGTTIGYKRLIRFNTIITDKVRLRILSSRLNPCLAEIGIYNIQE